MIAVCAIKNWNVLELALYEPALRATVRGCLTTAMVSPARQAPTACCSAASRISDVSHSAAGRQITALVKVPPTESDLAKRWNKAL